MIINNFGDLASDSRTVRMWPHFVPPLRGWYSHRASPPTMTRNGTAAVRPLSGPLLTTAPARARPSCAAPRGKRNRVRQAGRAVPVCSKPVRQGQGGACGLLAKPPWPARRKSRRMTTFLPRKPKENRVGDRSLGSVQIKAIGLYTVLFFALLLWTVKPGPDLRGMYYLASWGHGVMVSGQFSCS